MELLPRCPSTFEGGLVSTAGEAEFLSLLPVETKGRPSLAARSRLRRAMRRPVNTGSGEGKGCRRGALDGAGARTRKQVIGRDPWQGQWHGQRQREDPASVLRQPRLRWGCLHPRAPSTGLRDPAGASEMIQASEGGPQRPLLGPLGSWSAQRLPSLHLGSGGQRLNGKPAGL